MNASYNPTRPMLRCAFAAVAVAVTLSIGGLLDALAQHYSTEGQQLAAKKPVMVANQ
jgi:hypothetical protein